MGRLIKLSEREEEVFDKRDFDDPYLGKYVQIVNTKSKYFSYYAWVGKRIANNDRYKLIILPKEFENKEEDDYRYTYIKRIDAPKWLNIIE